MTMQDTQDEKLQDDIADDSPESQEESPAPYYTGDTGELAAIFESSGFNAVKELLDFNQDLEAVLPKAEFTPQRANLMRRMAMKEMVEQTGSLDRISLMKLEAAISAAVDGKRSGQVVRILAGMGEGAREVARAGIDRMKDFGRKF